MNEQKIQKDIATALNQQYPAWGAFPATARDNTEYVEFICDETGERYIITIQKGL